MKNQLVRLALAIALLALMPSSTIAATEGTDPVDLSHLVPGRVVVQGTLHDGECAYPEVKARLAPRDAPVTLESDDACAIRIGEAGRAAFPADLEPRCGAEQNCTCPAPCAGQAGDPCCAPPEVVAAECFGPPPDLACGPEADSPFAPDAQTWGTDLDSTREIVGACAGGGLPRTLRSTLSSGWSIGPTWVTRQITACPGLVYVGDGGGCGRESENGWRSTGCNYNVDNFQWNVEMQRGIRGDFHHHHFFWNNGEHLLQTWARVRNDNNDACDYAFTWNSHTNAATMICTYV